MAANAIPAQAHSGERSTSVYSVVNRRILPFLATCYLFAYLDRINIGFAKLQMQNDLALSDAAYGLGAGIFFFGYMLFEVPSNLLLVKIGARRTLSRILILWGIVSASMLFVTDVWTFYALRFLLGVFEAGFAPGMIYYLTQWYPGERMARAMAVVLGAAPLGGVIGGPASTWIMGHFAGAGGLAGWQWMFLAEGIPSILLGIAAYGYLKPADARWLTDAQKAVIAGDIARAAPGQASSFGKALTEPKLYVLAAAYFCLICGVYAVGFWLPSILKSAGLSDLFQIGLYSAIPNLAMIVAMYALGRRSDRRGERHLHSAITAVLGAGLLAWAAYATSFPAALISITLASAAIFASYSVFWAIPQQHLKGTAAAGGIALINSIGLFGGFFSPTLIGWTKEATGSLQAGLLVMAALLVLGAVLLATQRAQQPPAR
ncbi:MFS transporter [Ralstonia pseudosolanacearum]|uniref:MFS transporter n=1 Tax=Ralstonia pseudosolanacearum TaxID=1310165 RepID=UPI00048C62A4|nr:MFS transporter [Ralstonia pseudosolanacearum]MDO3555790.1 MFS transporter [Ralstonia pseudosolanacearum]MDO3563175.1 MFS transporter [Ralstonia pseudosolanacearum]MDO3572753.1 MFS transporter [Ralstonia pseudosolanacearum]MDO3576433.1 MFS transporter [Ralstonia pseudosolanacearum]MDO3585166.1 MFS transporter [Ralstonia pseudosolanacearum]